MPTRRESRGESRMHSLSHLEALCGTTCCQSTVSQLLFALYGSREMFIHGMTTCRKDANLNCSHGNVSKTWTPRSHVCLSNFLKSTHSKSEC
jgi:hypothetical protein